MAALPLVRRRGRELSGALGWGMARPWGQPRAHVSFRDSRVLPFMCWLELKFQTWMLGWILRVRGLRKVSEALSAYLLLFDVSIRSSWGINHKASQWSSVVMIEGVIRDLKTNAAWGHLGKSGENGSGEGSTARCPVTRGCGYSGCMILRLVLISLNSQQSFIYWRWFLKMKDRATWVQELWF